MNIEQSVQTILGDRDGVSRPHFASVDLARQAAVRRVGGIGRVEKRLHVASSEQHTSGRRPR